MKISQDIHYIGVNDHQVDLFEGQYVVPNGMAYNSYVIMDEKIAVMDTVDINFTHEWLDNLDDVLNGKTPDYLIVQHMEPDHSANILNFIKTYPDATIVANAKTFVMMDQFFDLDSSVKRLVVKNGETLSLGQHDLTFVFAPMVHWPEVMVTYDSKDKVLFSADGFGKFGANDVEEDWACEARRYYIGIVGKYGAQVQALLKKAANLDIQTICPLHGPVLTENLGYYLNLYNIWSSYGVESEGIVIAYTSVYGNTKKAVELLAEKLKEKGCPKVAIHDLARDDIAEAVEDAFRYGKLVLATTTYNADVFPFMKEFINHLTERNFQNRTVALIENGSWSPLANKTMKEMLSGCKNITFTNNSVTIKSAVKNGLIVNTVTQVSDSPNRVAVNINKQNYSHHVIKQTGKLNVNCLSVEAPFSVFERFGFQSGRTVDKFADFKPLYSDNGLAFLPRYINAFMSLEVENYVDLDTHGMFICKVSEARVMSDKETMSYNYYQDHVKPKPNTDGKKGFVCKVCGYIYEGDTLPDDYICPLCKHGAIDFEPIED